MAFCRDCGKEIFFLKTKKGKLIPVNAESMTEIEKDDCKNGNQRLFKPLEHVTHFSDCPAAESFRRRDNG